MPRCELVASPASPMAAIAVLQGQGLCQFPYLLRPGPHLHTQRLYIHCKYLHTPVCISTIDEIASSNLLMSSKDVEREKALAAWRYTPSKEKEKNQSHGVAWNIVESSQRDMEFVVRALQRELNSGPGADHLFVNPNNIFTERTSNNNNIYCENSSVSNSDETLPKKLAGKKRCRESGKSPVTFVAADPDNFSAMVQKATGGKISGTATANVVKPQPKRPSLPLLDSSCLNSKPSFTAPLSCSPGAANSFFSINDLPSWDGIPLYSPGLAAVTLDLPSPSWMPSGLGNYDNYLDRDATSAAPERFMNAACIWNGSIFS